MSNKNDTQKVISSFYFLDNNLQLQKIVTSKNVISAIHEQELNGLIRADIELDLTYSKFLVSGIDYVGYHYRDNFYLHKIQRVEHDHVDDVTKIVLRHIFFEDMLYGKIIKDIRPENREASYVLRNTIDTHSRWRTVMTDTTGSLSTNFYWQVMYEVIEFVTENYRIEYLPVLKFDGQKITSFELHAANRIGENKNIRIPFGSRVLELKYDVDYSEIVTRLVGHGKGEEVGDGYGRRIDFKDINFNKNGVVSPIGDVYMEDESVTAQYGNDGQTPREGRIVFEDIEDPNELANATYEHYLKVSRPQMLFTADVADIGDVGIGDSVLIIRREHDVYFKARIHKLTVDLLNPNDAQIELGDYEHFKYSKVEKARAKSDKEFKKETNNRIESLKRQFDTEFDAQVDEFRKEFEQKLIDVSAEIVADQERMENEMSQMKLEQQQRVDEIYKDIGGINQTVSDVANKADYLDGLYTDLSTQTGEVTSTVANIIDGKAPAGSVLKQTIDSVVGRVWEQDIDSLNFENRNLLKNTDFTIEKNVNNLREAPSGINISQSKPPDYDKTFALAQATLVAGNYIGFQTRNDRFKVEKGQQYTLSFIYIVPSTVDENMTYTYLMNPLPNAEKPNQKLTLTSKTKIGTAFTSFNVFKAMFTFTANWSEENAWLLIGSNVISDGNAWIRISEPKLEKGNKATPYSQAPEDFLKHTDLVLRPDGFLLGSFEMGGDKIAQAIVGKAGAIDLIADNVNLSNNLNVANQIKSLSLETVYANISELRTRMLVADVITADMVKFDTALIEKFTSSTAFINSLFAKSATIGHIQAIDIDLNRATVTGGDGTNYIRMTNQTIMSYGTFTRSWGGETDTARLELGMYDGQLRMRNLDTGYRLYLTERGLSTSMAGAIDQFTSGTLEFHSQRFNATSRGITMHSSYGAVAMVSDYSTAVIRSRLTANIESDDYSVYLRPYRNTRNGLNEFQFYVKANSSSQDTDGVIYFGDITGAGTSGCGLRFSKARGLNTLWATDPSGDKGTGTFEAIDFLSYDVSSGYRSRFFGNNIGAYIQNNNGARITRYKSGTLAPIVASEFNTGSYYKYKHDISEWNYDVLSVIKKEFQAYQYVLNGDETRKVRHGSIVGGGYNIIPEFVNNDGVDLYEMTTWALRGVQQLAFKDDDKEKRIKVLENENQALKMRLATLEQRVA